MHIVDAISYASPKRYAWLRTHVRRYLWCCAFRHVAQQQQLNCEELKRMVGAAAYIECSSKTQQVWCGYGLLARMRLVGSSSLLYFSCNNLY
jgi:hypothetical protein